MLGRPLDERSHWWFHLAVNPKARIPAHQARCAHSHNTGVKVTRVTNCFLIGSETCFTEENYITYCEPGHKTVAWKVIGPMVGTDYCYYSTVVLSNGLLNVDVSSHRLVMYLGQRSFLLRQAVQSPRMPRMLSPGHDMAMALRNSQQPWSPALGIT